MFALQIITDEGKQGRCTTIIARNSADLEKAKGILQDKNTRHYDFSYEPRGCELLVKPMEYLHYGTTDQAKIQAMTHTPPQ